MCDVGTSRWFNYYVHGLLWSTSQSPHIDGIYYDGINFDRRSMQRVRKVLDAGAGKRGTPLIDIHTGAGGPSKPAATRCGSHLMRANPTLTPTSTSNPTSTTSTATSTSTSTSVPTRISPPPYPPYPHSLTLIARYLSHFAYADSAWNGESFDWGRGPIYWLVAASGFIHGIAADRLGGAGFDFKALLFAMYTRNHDTAPPVWGFWRDVDIGAADMAMHGWWSDAPPVKLGLQGTGACSTASSSAADVDATTPLVDGASTAVLVTSHVAKGRLTVLVLASWCATDTAVTLRTIDWEALGLDPAVAHIEQPAVAKLQAARPAFAGANASAHPLAIRAGRGVVLVVRTAS